MNKKLIRSSLLIFVISFLVTLATRSFASDTQCAQLAQALPKIYDMQTEKGSSFGQVAFVPIQGSEVKFHVYTVQKSKDSKSWSVLRNGVESAGAELVRNVASLATIDGKCALNWSTEEGKSPVTNYLYRIKAYGFSLGGETTDQNYEVLRFVRVASLKQLK